MNALFLIHRYPPAIGGSERYVQSVARRMAAAGHRVTVYTSTLLDVQGFWRRGARELPAGVARDVAARTRGAGQASVEIHRYHPRVLPLHGAITRALGRVPWAPVGLSMAPPGLVLPGMWQAVRAARGFDLVYAAAYPSLMYLGAVAAGRMGARLVLMPCSHPAPTRDGRAAGCVKERRSDKGSRHDLPRRLVRLYQQADALVALTRLEKEWLAGAGISPSRIVVTGAGIDPTAGSGASGRRFRRRHDLDEDTRLLTFVGQKTQGKGAIDLLEAGRILLGRRSDVILVMVGVRTPAFQRHYRALPPGIRQRVLDVQLDEDEKHDLLAASTALLLPSRDDSFGIVLLEAWLHGKPVVGARAGGIPAVIEEGITGLLVPPGDVPAITVAVNRLLDHPLEAARMGSRGRERTLARWTWDAVFSRLAPVLEGTESPAPRKPEGSA